MKTGQQTRPSSFWSALCIFGICYKKTLRDTASNFLLGTTLLQRRPTLENTWCSYVQRLSSHSLFTLLHYIACTVQQPRPSSLRLSLRSISTHPQPWKPKCSTRTPNIDVNNTHGSTHSGRMIDFHTECLSHWVFICCWPLSTSFAWMINGTGQTLGLLRVPLRSSLSRFHIF